MVEREDRSTAGGGTVSKLPPSPAPCTTARRLALLKRLCAGATCETTRRMVRRVAAAWRGNGEAGGYDVKVTGSGWAS